jgi:4-hydroxy-4-methyl-2-oxoglutarate aldolase
VVSHGNPICVSVGDEVTISGMKVRTGDLLHGDVNGILHIPDECAVQVAEAAQAIWKREGETMRNIQSPDFRVPRSEIKH